MEHHPTQSRAQFLTSYLVCYACFQKTSVQPDALGPFRSGRRCSLFPRRQDARRAKWSSCGMPAWGRRCKRSTEKHSIPLSGWILLLLASIGCQVCLCALHLPPCLAAALTLDTAALSRYTSAACIAHMPARICSQVCPCALLPAPSLAAVRRLSKQLLCLMRPLLLV